MSTITELNPRLAALTEAGVGAAGRVVAEGDPAEAVRALAGRITAIL